MGEIKQNSSRPSAEKEMSREVHREAPRPMPKAKKKKVAKPIFFSVLILALIAFGTFYFIKYQQLSDKYVSLTMTEEDKTRKIIAKVSELYKIPTYEEEKPLLVEVKDKSKLADSTVAKAFFKDVNEGDVVLAYQKGDISIIYREKEQKIIHTDNYTNFIGAVNPVKVALIASADKQVQIGQTLKDKFSNLIISDTSTPKTAVSQGVVVDVSGKEADAATKLASILGLPVGALPAGETAPQGASMVVVLPTEAAPAPAP